MLLMVMANIYHCRLGVPVNLHDERLDINVVSGALKLYLRELLNPVIPLELYTEFMDAGSEIFSLVFKG